MKLTQDDIRKADLMKISWKIIRVSFSTCSQAHSYHSHPSRAVRVCAKRVLVILGRRAKCRKAGKSGCPWNIRKWQDFRNIEEANSSGLCWGSLFTCLLMTVSPATPQRWGNYSDGRTHPEVKSYSTGYSSAQVELRTQKLKEEHSLSLTCTP